MVEITFAQIHSFLEYCHIMNENVLDCEIDCGEMTTKGKKNYRFSPVILMSLDMERLLRSMAGVKFGKNLDGRTTFDGIPIIEIIADGYLSFCWEASNE